jgi:DNA-binding CsgD family transcriptional regulator
MRTDEQTLDRIIDDLYAAALEAAAWDRAMARIARFMNARGQLCVSLNPSTGQAYREQAFGYEPATVVDYHANWAAKDPRILPGLQHPPGIPLTEHDMLPMRPFRCSEFFNEFLVACEVPWVMGVWLHQDASRCTYFSVQGGIDRQPFDDTDRTWMLRLAPHIKRSLEIQDRLESANVRALAFSSALEHATFGTLILDAAGYILDASQDALATLRQAGALMREPGGLYTLRGFAAGLLRQLLGSAMRAGALNDGSLQIGRGAGRLPLSLVVVPAPQAMASWFPHDACWIGMLFDPETRVEVSAEVLRSCLQLTAREAQVTALLVGGLSLKEIAVRLGLSFHTVRAQLKSVFLKTGAKSQTELVRKVMAGPAVQPRRAG